MGVSGAPDELRSERIVASRYRIEKEIGRGGMAVAYEVLDSATGEHVALKRLTRHGDDPGIVQLFEREYHSLVQLAHPCVVQALDFGRGEDGRAFYTMELLDGGDLHEIGALPYRRVCELLSDVCSALSLLHSRRLLHRDLTPRNIRCTRNGKAKLIDFGAVTPFGPVKRVVGTPAFSAPEMLAGQDLDGRADLFALGATLYFALTGHHAFPVSRFNQLRNAWRTAPRAPSSWVAEIPAALDELVLSLLHLERSARPNSAAEVMERLAAIGGHEIAEQLVVQQSYLSTPTLIGRDEELLRVRKLMVRAMRGRGGTMFVSGASGVGRSRFLSACVLEGKLLGAIALRVDASDSRNGPFAAARELARQLFQAAPQCADELTDERRSLLSQLLPELRRDDAGVVDSAASRSPSLPPRADEALAAARPQLQAALRDLLLGDGERCIQIAVDDLHLIDEASAALIAVIAHSMGDHAGAVVATADSDALHSASGALRLVAEVGGAIKLDNLSSHDTHKLLGSIFSDVPNLQLLSDELYKISAGSPGALMELAQHLLDQGVVRYEAGAWMLPSSLDTGTLPKSLGQAISRRVDRLGGGALQLGQTLALIPNHSVAFEEALTLSEHGDTRKLLRELDQLVAAQFAHSEGGYYGIKHSSVAAALRERLDDGTRARLHARLAELFEQRKASSLLIVDHLVQAGKHGEAIARVEGYVRDFDDMPVELVVASISTLPEGWQRRMRELLDMCERLGRPKRERFLVLAALITYGSVSATAQPQDVLELIEQTWRDCGLDIYASLDDALPHHDRLTRALQQAQQRYDATPTHERVEAPLPALKRLARTVFQAIAVIGGRYDYAFLEQLPSIEPLATLSPALDVVHRNLRGTTELTAGRFHRAIEIYSGLVERLQEPDGAGLDATHNTYVLLALRYALAVMSAAFGDSRAMVHLGPLEQDPLYAVQACRLRMAYALRKGDLTTADEYKRQAELLQVQNSPPQFFEGSGITLECSSYAFVGDLARLKQTLPVVEELGSRLPGWRPVASLVRGMYQELRGDNERALREFSLAVVLCEAGRHPMFCACAAARTRALTRIGRVQEACRYGEDLAARAEQADLGPSMHQLYEALALAHSGAGDHLRAARQADRAIELLEQVHAEGITIGGAYEVRARVAVTAGDDEVFRSYAQKCATAYRSSKNPMLHARYEGLLRTAKAKNLEISPELDDAVVASDARAVVDLLLTECFDAGQRARRALSAIVDAVDAEGGFLYGVGHDGLTLAAQVGGHPPPPNLDSEVNHFLSAEVQASRSVVMTRVDGEVEEEPDVETRCAGSWIAPDGAHFFPTLLAHRTARGLEISGLVALRHSKGRPVHPGRDISEAVSQALHDAGDVVTLLAAE